MFCGKCGIKNEDNAQFCIGCGAKLKEDQPVGKKTLGIMPPEDRDRKVGMAAVAIIAVIAIIAIVSIFSGRSYKETINQYFYAQFEADAKALFELVPEDLIEYILEEEGYDDDELDELLDEVNENFEDELKYLKKYLGENMKISHKILDIEDIKGDDLKDIKDTYKDFDIKVSAAKTIEVEFTVIGEETESVNTMDVPLIKVGSSWYLDVKTLEGIF